MESAREAKASVIYSDLRVKTDQLLTSSASIQGKSWIVTFPKHAVAAVGRYWSIRQNRYLRRQIDYCSWTMPNHERWTFVRAELGLINHVPFGLAGRQSPGHRNSLKRRVFDEYLTRFLQLGQTSLRLIRVRRVWMFFYDLPVKFRSVRLVVLLLFQLRGIV
jgi:hypothetical protein